DPSAHGFLGGGEQCRRGDEEDGRLCSGRVDRLPDRVVYWDPFHCRPAFARRHAGGHVGPVPEHEAGVEAAVLPRDALHYHGFAAFRELYQADAPLTAARTASCAVRKTWMPDPESSARASSSSAPLILA